jgi:hypothetical protein
VSGGVFGGGPGIGKTDGVVVPDEHIFVALGRGPTASAWSAIGEMPGEEEGEIGGALRRVRPRQSAPTPLRASFGTEFPSAEKSSQKSIGSSTSGHAASRAGSDVGARGVESRESETALQRGVGGRSDCA